MRVFIAIVFMVSLMASTGHAATENIVEGMGQKAIRGIVNLVTGIVELPMQIYKGYDKGFEPIENEVGSKTVGTILGFFRGLGHAAGRMSWGALELVGFWAVNPEDNEGVGIPLDAEYAWEMGEQYDIFEPSLGEGIKPIGTKLGHGLANTFLGIAELPGQIMQGTSEGNVLLGLGEGFWFWLSREVYGIGNIFSCLLPNPKDNPGYAFDAQWPWSALSQEVE
jgi:putative exosortase-associated protein (TIGR04073 family)